MKCNDIRELLSLYIDQMLDESQVKEVEEHLSACDACRNEYNELKEMLDLLGHAEMIPVPDTFHFRLKKALKEEKQSMLATGMIGKPLKKKSQWRILTSVAAVFAVGVLSFGLYRDVLGILPDKLNGGDQTGAVQAEEPYNAESNELMSDADRSSDGSIVMKDEAADLPPMETANELADSDEMLTYSAGSSTEPEDIPMTTYGLADGSEPNNGDEYGAVADTVTEQEAAAGSAGFDENNAVSRKQAPSSEECSRSLTSSGVERNAAAVQYYNNLMEEKLNGFDYQVLDSGYAKTGEWQFRIFIFRGKDGNTYNEEILIIGKDGEIEIICSNEFMGL